MEGLHGGCGSGGDLQEEGIINEPNRIAGFDAMEEQEQVIGGEDGEIWIGGEQEGLLVTNDSSIFYGDHFPPLPGFPCMSSSSSSSSTPAPVKASSSSSSASSASSATSWAVLKSDGDEDVEKKSDNHYHHYRQQQLDFDNHNLETSYDIRNHNCDHHFQVKHEMMNRNMAATLSSTTSMKIPQPPDQGGIDGVDCMNATETFGYMDLLENNDLFYPSSMFQSDETLVLDDFQSDHQQPPNLLLPPPQQQQEVSSYQQFFMQTRNDEAQHGGWEGGGAAAPQEDLSKVFLDWLKINRDAVSAEDLRRVRIKKATIDCASNRLGGGKEGMKKLLKLILEWVQTNHLQRRRMMMRESSSSLPYQYPQQEDPLQSPNPSVNCNPIPPPDQPNPCFNQSPWIPPPGPPPRPPPPYVGPGQASVLPGLPPMVGYMGGDPFANGGSSINGHPYPLPPDYNMLEPAQSWPPSQFSMTSPYPFPDNNLQPPPPQSPAFTAYGNQCPYPQFLQAVQPTDDSRLVRLASSATKEARKKRMARQKRFFSHHRHHHHHNQHNNQQNQHQNLCLDRHARLGNDTGAPIPQANPGNWVYWQPNPAADGSVAPPTSVPPVETPAPPQPMTSPVDRPATQQSQRQAASDKRQQGAKTEKNLRFLLQKVLKQSDVGSLGRIVLPKKEAETHLPQLEARDGISIAMEDIGTSRVWNMRYRYWPNNKSRMYLLENTGDFVRDNGLQEGDFIVIYSDVKCGKYLIRGVKVRQPGLKPEGKKQGKSSKNCSASSPGGGAGAGAVNDSSSSPILTQHQHQNQNQNQNQIQKAN